MGWIKCDHELWIKPEVIEMASSLGISENEVVGALLRVWSWADKYSQKGNAPSVTKTFLNRYSGVENFAECMEKVGWLDTSNGGFSIPKFDRHNGEGAKKRIQNALRQSKFKGGKGGNKKVTHEALPERYKEEEQQSIKYPPTPKGDVFIAPSLEECQAYAKHLGLNGDFASEFLEVNKLKGWVDKNGKPYEDWRRVMVTWKSFRLRQGDLTPYKLKAKSDNSLVQR